MRGAQAIGRVSLAVAMAGLVWISAMLGPGPNTRAQQGLAGDQAQLTQLLNQLRAQGDLASQSQVMALLTQIESEQSYLKQLNAKLAADQATSATLQRQMAGDQIALTNLVSTAYVDGSGSQQVAEALAAPNLGQFLASAALPSAVASQVAQLVGTIKHDQQVVATATAQLQAAESQAMVAQAQLGQRSQQLLAELTTPQPAIGTGSWSFAFGDCTWWVASQRKVTWGGNAYQWWANAAAAGYAEGQTPEVGSIVVWGIDVPGESWGYGHVAYVVAVKPGSFEVSEMNFYGVPGGGWDRVDYRWVQDGAGYLGFIYGPA